MATHPDPGGSDAGNAAWHRQLHHTGSDELSEDTAQTPGMRRYEAISGKRHGSRKLWMGKAVVAPGMVSGDHHHGKAETGIYVVSGHPVFVFLEDGAERRIELAQATASTCRPTSPTARGEPLARRGDDRRSRPHDAGWIVVNLPSLREEVPELDRLLAELTAEPDG